MSMSMAGKPSFNKLSYTDNYNEKWSSYVCISREEKTFEAKSVIKREEEATERERERVSESEDEDGRQAVLEAVEFWCCWKGCQHKRKHLDETEKEDTWWGEQGNTTWRLLGEDIGERRQLQRHRFRERLQAAETRAEEVGTRTEEENP